VSHVLLAGESWISATVDHKGFDAFPHTDAKIPCRRAAWVSATRLVKFRRA